MLLEHRQESNTFCFENSVSQKKTHKLDPEGMQKNKQCFTLMFMLRNFSQFSNSWANGKPYFYSNSRNIFKGKSYNLIV